MLIIHIDSGPPFRVDANPRQTLWVKNSTATAWTPVTNIRPGDNLFTVNGWVQVTSIEFAPAGTHVMFDIIATAPYLADGYLDPIHKEGPTGTPSGNVGAGYSFAFSYSGEALSSITYNDSSVAGYTYDSLGRVSNVSINNAGTLTTIAQLTYHLSDQVKGIGYGNNLVANYTYTKLGQPYQITVKNGATTLLSLSYGYNKTGTVASVTGQSTTTTGGTLEVREQHSYDPLQRLVKSNVTSGNVKTILSYQYDNLGNRQSQTVNGVTTSYTYNLSNNELTTSSIPKGANTAYSYDPNGNLLTVNVTSGKKVTHQSYAWDVPGNLVKVSNDTAVQGFYGYDGLGRRIEAKEGSTTTFFGYQGTETLADLFNGGSANDYVYADGLRIARTGAQTSTVYYHTDALGTTRMVTNASRNVVFSDNYQPFGQDNGTPTGSETYKFTGKPVSQTTGLYYEYARWYDPMVGRFISQDLKQGRLSNPQSLNRYIYVLDIPTTLTDPAGLDGGFGADHRCEQNPGSCGGPDPVVTWWNNLTPSQQAQVYTVGVDVAAIGAVALTVVTLGATAPLAVVAIGAAVGASTSTTVYTWSQGDKATIAGAAGATITGAIAGAVGGGAGIAAGSIGGVSGTIVGSLIAGAGSVGGDLAGKAFTSGFGGEKFDVTGKSLLLDLSIGALTFGIGSRLGNVGQNYVAGRIISEYDQPLLVAYFAGGAFSVESNLANVAIGYGTEAFGDFLHGILPDQLPGQ